MITRSQMRRQLRAQGGIMNVAPREKFGLGSSIKERLRKLIPNELASVATKAAPFVAPFNPAIAGIMRGVGRFDQRGSISDALKQGIGTYAGGQAARMLGGGETQLGFRGADKKLFTSPLNAERTQAVKGLFQKDTVNPFEETANAGKITGTPKTEGLDVVREASDKVFSKIPGGDKLPSIVKQKLLVGSITSGASALYSYFTGGFEPQQPGETMGEYLARRNVRVKQQMRGYMDSYYTPLRNPQYAAMSDEEKDNYIDSITGQGMATGGRVGYQTGGISMTNTAAQNRAINNAQRGMNKANMATARARNKQQNFVKNMFNVATGSGAHERATREYLNPFKGGKTYDTAYLQKNNPEVVDYMSSYLKNYINPKNQAGGKFGQSGVMSVTGLGRSPNIFTKQGMSEAAKSSSDPSFQAENLFGQGTLKKTPTGYDYTGGKFDFNFEPGTMMSGVEKYLLRPSEYKLSFDKDFNPITQTTTSTPDASTTIPEYYRSNPNNYDFDKFKQAYAKSLDARYGEGQGGGTTTIGADGQIQTSFGNFDPSRTYQAYMDNTQTSSSRPFYEDIYGNRSAEEQAAIEKQKAMMASMYGVPGAGKKYFNAGGRVGLMGGTMPMGEPRVNQGGITELDYRAKGGFVPVGIKEKADDVPAMLSKNEFVFTADAVRGAGNGSIENGAQKMYDTMKNLERRVT